MTKSLVSKIKNRHNLELENLLNDDLIEAYIHMIQAGEPDFIKHISVDMSLFDDCIIMNLGDLHIGDPNCDFQRLITYLTVAKYYPNVIIIMNGDIVNNANNLGKSSSLENALSPSNEMRIFYKLLNDPIIKDKIVAITSGNHENGERTKEVGIDMVANMTSGTAFFEKYSRYITRLNIKLKCPYTPTGSADMVVTVTHGSNLKGKDGKIIDTMIQKEAEIGSSDLIIVNHTHKEVFSVVDKLATRYVDGKKQTYKITTTIYNSPSVVESSGYAKDKMMGLCPTFVKFPRVYTLPNHNTLDNTKKENTYERPFSIGINLIDVIKPNVLDFVKAEQPRIQRYVNKTIEDIEADAEQATLSIFNIPNSSEDEL